jgi:hypothetical protein
VSSGGGRGRLAKRREIAQSATGTLAGVEDVTARRYRTKFFLEGGRIVLLAHSSVAAILHVLIIEIYPSMRTFNVFGTTSIMFIGCRTESKKIPILGNDSLTGRFPLPAT